MGIPWESRGNGNSHSHAHFYSGSRLRKSRSRLINSGSRLITDGSVVFDKWRQCAPHIQKAKKWLPWQGPTEPRNQIAWPRKPTHRIKYRAASYHTTEIIGLPIESQKVVAIATSLKCKVWAISAFCRPTTQVSTPLHNQLLIKSLSFSQSQL